MIKIIKMLLAPFAVFSLALGVSISLTTPQGIAVHAAEYLNNVATFPTTTYADGTSSGSLNADWDWVGVKNEASTITRTWSGAIRMYGHSSGNGGEFRINPSASNTTKILTKVTIQTHSTSGGTPTYAFLTSANGTTWTSVQTGTIVEGSAYTYTNATGFKYFSVKDTGTAQLHFTTVTFDYKDEETVYSPVQSLATNFTETQFAIGQEYAFAPTILPAEANQSFVVSSLSPAIQVTGSTIKAIGVATNVVVTITTVGKNASDQTISQDVTFNTFQATTTVAEALTLTPDGKIVYLVENALVSDGYNTQYDRQIQLVDTVEPTKNILIFKYGINPLNSYRYIAGGTISFKATLGIYSGVNQFTDPIIISYSDDVETFATSILAGDVEGQCETRFAGYKTTVLGFDTIELAKLQNGTDANIVSARDRYIAWAANQNENPYSAEPLSGSNFRNESHNNILMAVVIIGTLGLITILGYYFLKKKKLLG